MKPVDEKWTPLVELLEGFNYSPDEWIAVFKTLHEAKIEAADMLNPKKAAKKLSPFMVMELTKLATTASSEQVRQRSATEIAYIGGAQPPKQKDDEFDNLSVEECDARIESFFEEADKKSKRGTKKRTRTTDFHEGDDFLEAADQVLRSPEGGTGEVSQKQET